jgi:poly-gamma-glutamate capsule biosynthesis protein CapA/YwtB (metallophosphatase superfamily)
MKKIMHIIIYILLGICSVSAQGTSLLECTFLGDIMAHNVNYRMKNYKLIYEGVKDILLTDDLSFANLEFPIVADSPYSTYPQFNVQPPYVDAAIKAGIEVFSLANNHATDQSDEGVLKTLAAILLLKEEAGGNLYYSGLRGNSKQTMMPETIYKNGIKIGFLALTQFLNIPQEQPFVYMVDYNNEEQVKELITLLLRITPHYDLFILSYHGGVEYAEQPDPKKVTFFKALIRAGVDIVYGHHPHVLQPFEVITHNNSSKLIIYSMGNFISGQTWRVNPKDPYSMWANTGDSVLLKVTVEVRNSNAHIKKIQPIPISHYIKPDKDIVVRKLENLAAQSLYSSWSYYYKIRLSLMKKFLQGLKEEITTSSVLD